MQKVMPVVGTAAEISSSPSGYTAGKSNPQNKEEVYPI